MLARPEDLVQGANLAPSAPTWRELRLRIASAAVLLPFGVACIWLGGWLFTAMIAGFAAGLAREFVLMRRRTASALPIVAYVAFLAGLAALPSLGLTVPALVVLAAAMLVLASAGAPGLAMGAAYVGGAAVALPWLRLDPDVGRAAVLMLFVVVWSSDVGAYAFGKLLGGPPLAPRISPGKTWAGAVGGLLSGAAAAGLLATLLGAPAPAAASLAALLVSAAAQAGDLLESWIKRYYGVKDSGAVIPGHGGLLDRLDGVLVAGPVAAALALWAGPGAAFWLVPLWSLLHWPMP